MCFKGHTIKRVKSQHTEWEKILAKYLSDKSYPEYMKNSYNLIK